MSRKCFLGIDPGGSGGIALIHPECEQYPGSYTAVPMPDTEKDIWEKILDWTTWPNDVKIMAVIEKVHSMPRQGVVSTFKFGQSLGFLRGCLIASSVCFDEVTPQAWQKVIGIPARKKTETKVAFKNRLKAKASQLFPKIKMTLSIADALLIAEYARRTYG